MGGRYFDYLAVGGRRDRAGLLHPLAALREHPQSLPIKDLMPIRPHGAGAGAPRLVTGDHPLFGALESRLAATRSKAPCWSRSECFYGRGACEISPSGKTIFVTGARK